MEDLSAAISSFLSQPGAMEQVEAMAKQLGLGSGASETEADAQQPGSLGGLMDEISPEKLQGILSAVQSGGSSCQSTSFLEALQPLLKEEKQEKLNRAIRAIRLMHTARAVSKTIEL